MSYKNACVIPDVLVGIVNWLSADVPALSVLTVIMKSSDVAGPAKSL